MATRRVLDDSENLSESLLPKHSLNLVESAMDTVDSQGVYRRDLSEQEKKDIARKRVQRIFKLPLTFKKPQHSSGTVSPIDLTPTPASTGAEEIKRYQHIRPRGHFLIVDYNKSDIQVKCEKDFRNADRPEWSTVRWIHLDSMDSEALPILKDNLPAYILVKDITRPTHKFRVEEHERYVLLVLHLVANYDEEAVVERRNATYTSRRSSQASRNASEISTIRLVVYLFFESNTLVTVTETPETKLADCILTRLSRVPSRIRNLDCSYLLYYILKFTLAPLQMIINFHSEYLETMEDKITFQRMELTSYQNIFHEIHEIRRELQHLRERLINIAEAIDDVREIAVREQEARGNHITTSTQLSHSAELRKSAHEPHSSSDSERHGIFPDRLKLANVVRLQFKHLSNNTMQMANQTTTLQEICSWLADLVFQTLSQKMNVTMKTLTLVSMVFIPLTFIVGVYGTNFEFLPELRWKYGYLFLWGLCLLVVVIELILFRKMRWL